MTQTAIKPRWPKAAFAVPLIVVGLLGLLFAVALRSGDPSRLPSALIGKPAPEFLLPPIEGVTRDGKPVLGFSTADLAKGDPAIVTVWASWCPPCVQEQPTLVRFRAQHNIRLLGINYKDAPANAARFLARLGNPFDAIGADHTGRVAIDWGVYGVPETYVVDGQGQIIYKLVGPVTEEALDRQILPIIEKARATAQRGTSSG
jgi:cytochrome c biogenesis protein CcmG, thiol:disulfide interchange protein DsbE